MSVKMQINIDKEVLEASKNCWSSKNLGQNCAIGKAIYMLFGDLSWVTNNSIGIAKKGWRNKNYEDLGISRSSDYLIDLPKKAVKFISEFDSNSVEQKAAMSPISFEIDVPDEVIALVGGVEEVKQILSECKTMELV